MTGRRLSLFLALFLVFTINAQAAVTIPVVVKLLPGVNLSLITNLLGGTLIDSIPGTNTHLLRLPNLPLLTFTLRLLGVEWLELDRGVGVSKNHPLGVLNVASGTPSDWYKKQPAFKLVRADQALLHSTGSGVIIADINSRTDYSHPALIGHLTNGYDFVTGRPSDVANLHDDQSGIFSLDDDQSGIFSLDDDQSGILSLDDDQSGIFSLDENSGSKSHGTFVAGILAAVAHRRRSCRCVPLTTPVTRISSRSRKPFVMPGSRAQPLSI
jgi:subtilisin family serine protease